MKEVSEIDKSGGPEAFAEINEKSKKLEERAKAVGLNLQDPNSFPEDLKEKFEASVEEMMSDMMDDALKQ